MLVSVRHSLVPLVRVLPLLGLGFGLVQPMSSIALPDLPYHYSELEPVISTEIMKLHHGKHHLAYVNNLKEALRKMKEAQAKEDLPAIIKLQSAIKFNAGGHLNHSIFWKTLRPIHKLGGDHPPYGDFRTSMEQQFGSFESMKEKLSAASIALQGSGWGWLGYDKFTGKLAIATCANQDTLEDTTGLVPLFGIDVWEHAYYLQYENMRANYVNEIWKIVDWYAVQDLYVTAKRAYEAARSDGLYKRFSRK